MIYSFDMDGTLCTNKARLERWAGLSPTTMSEEEVDVLMADVCDDEATELVDTARHLSLVRTTYIVSARPFSTLQMTREWVIKHGIAADRVITRGKGHTHIPSHVWKYETLYELRGEKNQHIIHFDDDPLLVPPTGVTLIYLHSGQHVR